VNEPDDVLLGRADLERAFTALGERLARRGVVADVFIVGGAAMALAYDASRVTRDVDARFLPHGIVLEEARRVAGIIGVESSDQALQICADFYPDEPISPRSAAVLRELFG
jgi:hypothetical protein